METSHNVFNDNSLSSDIEEGELVEDNKDICPSDEEEKKLSRARRFGTIRCETSNQSSDPEIAELHKRMGVNQNTRTEALHLYLVENMKTQDVFAYFEGYMPASIEWIDDNSCNAVWLDEINCAKALLKNSVFIRGQNGLQDDIQEEECLDINDIRLTLPPGIWRKGRAVVLAPNLLIRYANFSDRKSHSTSHSDWPRKGIVFSDEGDETLKKVRVESGNPWVDIALQWGHYEHKSAINKKSFNDQFRINDARELLNKKELSKYEGGRPFGKEDFTFGKGDSVRSKMQADIEEEKILKNKLNLFSNTRSGTIDLRNRLRRKRRGSDHTLDSLRNCDVNDIRFDIEMAKQKILGRENEWSGTSSSSSSGESESEDDSRDSGDLRRKLGHSSTHKTPSKKTCKIRHCKSKTKKKKFVPSSPLQIEIDNDIYFENENNQ